MTSRRTVVTITVLGLLIGLAGTPWAQQNWDTFRWLELIGEGDRYYQMAIETPEEDDAEYRRLLRESLRYKQEALDLLRRALLLRQIEAVEQLSDDANLDLFNLTENIIVILLELDQCDAGEWMLDRSLTDTSILPEGGPAHLDALRPEFAECRASLSNTVETFDSGHYSALVASGDAWKRDADSRHESDTVGRRADLIESVQAYTEALTRLSDALERGVLYDVDGSYETNLYDLYDQLVTALLQADLCETAQRRLAGAVRDAESMPNGDPARFDARSIEVIDCLNRVAAAREPEPVVVTEQPSDPQEEDEEVLTHPPLTEDAELGIAPFVLLGVSGTTFLTAIVVDLIAMGDRDEHETLSDQCAAGPCDYDRLRELSDSLNDSKVAVGVLTGLTIVTGAIGAVLYLLGEDDALDTTEAQAYTPTLEINGLGANIRILF